MQEIGETIAKHATPDDLVLYTGFEMNAQILFYAKHNVEELKTRDELPTLLQKHHRKTAILIEIKDQKVVEITNISL